MMYLLGLKWKFSLYSVFSVFYECAIVDSVILLYKIFIALKFRRNCNSLALLSYHTNCLRVVDPLAWHRVYLFRRDTRSWEMRNLRLSHYYNIDPNDVYETRILIIVSIRALGASMNFRAYKVFIT